MNSAIVFDKKGLNEATCTMFGEGVTVKFHSLGIHTAESFYPAYVQKTDWAKGGGIGVLFVGSDFLAQVTALMDEALFERTCNELETDVTDE